MPDVRVLDVQRLDIQVLDVCESLVPVFQGARCPLVPFVPVFDVCEPYSNLITSQSVILSLLLLQLPHALLLQCPNVKVAGTADRPTRNGSEHSIRPETIATPGICLPRSTPIETGRYPIAGGRRCRVPFSAA